MEISIGEGIKKMKAYKSNLKIDELNSLRDDFFITRIKSQGEIWKNIRHACLIDSERSLNLITALKLKTINGCINHLKDSKENHYVIPNFCINDPYLEKIVKEINIKNKEENMVFLKLCNAYTQHKVDLEIDDRLTVLDMKVLYTEKAGVEGNYSSIRMFFGGIELKNENFIYQYDLKSGFMIIVMVRK